MSVNVEESTVESAKDEEYNNLVSKLNSILNELNTSEDRFKKLKYTFDKKLKEIDNSIDEE